ncbi:protein Wnt-8b-like [Babylonia areolata]|uniref:protein Wnt-8b-like n=1 Tax=Babylonia areolata TaxID=304850 RepID=UPI003FD68D4A
MELGLSECQYQFRWERWDCSDRSLLQVVHTAETPANQETAVVQALVTSGVMYVVARNCSTGALLSCTCDPHLHSNHTERNWKWKGCKNAGAKQGDTMSRALFDGVIEGADARAAVNRHNNQVGRAAVWRNLELRCKCHGVSGSCSLRTCWQRLPDFRRVGTFLKRRYTRAVHVNVQDGQLRHGNRARRRGLSMISSKDLVYLVPSPDYCRAQAPGGAASSTEGRECSRPPKGLKASRAERRSCRTLCLECGLRVRKYMVEVVTRCNCKFYWCCTVRCKECRQVVQKYYCQR